MKHAFLPTFVVTLLVASCSLMFHGCGSNEPAVPISSTATQDAAPHYQALFDEFGESFLRRIIDADDPNAFAHELETRADAIEVSKMPECNLPANYNAGFEVRVQSLGVVRSTAKMLRVDAERVARYSSEQAAARIRAMIRMGRHAGYGDDVAAKLVAITIVIHATRVTRRLADDGLLTPGDRNEIVSLLRMIDRRDPFNASHAIQHHRQWTIHQMRTNQHVDPVFAALWARLDDGMRKVGAEEADEALATIQSLWHLPDAEEQIQRIEDSSGAFARPALGGMSSFRSSVDDVIRKIEETIDALE